MPDLAALLPQPSLVRPGSGRLVLDDQTSLTAPPGWAAIVRRLLGPGSGLPLPDATGGQPDRSGAVITVRQDESLAAEAYRLSVTTSGIEIVAGDDRGVNWAVQTLRQLLPPSVYRAAPSGPTLIIDAIEIEDQPRFSWRGVMLDVGRHFVPYQQLFAFVDLLAMHKYNVFHLHLTEDQGWRFESRLHPELNEIASVRAETRAPHWESGDGTPHGGYYTQDQLKALVSYAGQRGITIVPEIEFPGHVAALLAAFPQFGNDPGRTYTAGTVFGVYDEVLNLSEEAMSFVFDIWTEVLEVFPSRYVHIGGDECPRTEWRASEAAHKRATARGLEDVDQLQRWFTDQLREWLTAHGREVIGWDEINNEGVVDDVTLLAWRDAKYGVEGAIAGQDVIMAPCQQTYFDYYPGSGADEPYSIGGLIEVKDAYAFDPVESVPAEAQHHVLGTQCQVWTEYLTSMRRVEYMLMPRACAHSEVAWSSAEHRSWPDFSARLGTHLLRLDALGINYRQPAGPRPWQRGGTGPWRRPAAHQVDRGDPEPPEGS